ncbi:plasmid stability [Synechococcus virus S-PRM1]|uniref:Plasmid stability protein n=1 Tax=Synechococcus virus S-PRM1 TaxID=2100130 RepID=A0A346FKP3_9CAUD|nr:plasmid stability [Synechococcus virus S-PRM1]AXN58548.1 hypothetical protein [Synechococcus virus S-PRM1]
MQKLINVIALLSGLTSLAVLGGGAYLYTQKDALVENVINKVTDAAVAGVAGALPGMLDAVMPEMPEVTGGVIPEGDTSLPKTTGPAVPF